MEDGHVDAGQFLFGSIFGTLTSLILNAAWIKPSSTARRWNMVTKQRARQERGRGVPLDDAERIARHYHVSIEDACELLTIYSVSDLLPERGSGLPTNVELVGHTANEFHYGLAKMEAYSSGGLDIAIVSREIPSEEELGAFYVRATAAGYRLSYPEIDIVDGLPVTSFKVRREPTLPGTTGAIWAALIPLIPTALIVGLVAFGITKIGDITKALVPLLLISFGGLIVLAGILTRKPVMEAAGKYAERRLPKTSLKYLPETLPKEWEFPKEHYPPPEKVGPEHLPRLARVDPKKFCCRQCGDCAPRELLAEGRFLDRISWLRGHYQEKHPGIWGHASTEPLEPGQFPKRDEALKSLEEYEIVRIHDDGDLTVESKGNFYVVTTEGDIFLRHTAKEALQKILSDQYLTITDPGKSTFKRGEVISLWAFYQENQRLGKRGETQASGTYEIKGRKEGGNGHRNLLEFLGDSPEFLAYTVDMTGWRQKLDETFETAIQRARS